MSDQLTTSPPFDTTALDQLLLEANLEMGRITQKEYETTKQQLDSANGNK